jgi:hypothetical protein
LETDELSGKTKNTPQDQTAEEDDDDEVGREEVEGRGLLMKKGSLRSLSSASSIIFDKNALKRTRTFLLGPSERDTAFKLTAFNVETLEKGLNCGAAYSFGAGAVPHANARVRTGPHPVARRHPGGVHRMG